MDSIPEKSRLFREQLILTEKIILIIVAICAILGNTFVLVATWRERSLHQPNKYFIACLAVADLVVGIFVAPMTANELNFVHESQDAKPTHTCRFMVWLDTFALTASFYILTVISFDRYLKISKPLHYRSRMTTFKLLKIISCIVLISSVSEAAEACQNLCNPVIYAWLDQTYRKAFKHLFKKIMCRPDARRHPPIVPIELRS
ncbi:5-hydroxytryptamine receptor 2B-like [Dendronephthya gigantea]|uniref:5-hydroxytryptamine receptor 2B-like n=1 Tax=Dendronephthya gigantea TaxID=151771 RepID=UPI00106989C8|nr:5-hydroxytryptamine receptor 2B-like [Dendronephthya gigantea]